MEALKQRTIRGGLAKLVGQGITFALRLLYIVVMARLLSPSEFGLVAMVTVVTGIYDLFRDGGLSAAAIQQATITEEQKSTLFWVNMLIGAILTLLCLLTAPILIRFYQEPRLFGVTAAISVGFLFGAAGAQYAAMLHRDLRYVTLAAIDVFSVIVNTAAAITMAATGWGYWSIVVPSVGVTIFNTVVMWLVVGWKPGWPRRNAGVMAMLKFGGTTSLNRLVVYVAYNLDKVLLGRFWGADALGLYSRAYQLINIPTTQLNDAIGGVAFSALSRLQNDSAQYKNYFLKGYSLVVALTAPITLFSAAFADDIIRVVMGPRWEAAATIFRLLTPTVLFFGLVNPLAWFLMSSGLQQRSLNIALVLAPICVVSYLAGLPYGPNGVAAAFSIALSLWLLPHMLWCIKGTGITLTDLLEAIWPPVSSAIVATIAAIAVGALVGHAESALLRFALNGSVMAATYSGMLLVVMGQKTFYLNLISQLRT
ncbi:lipopolysaccharide biosynthesis protein [Bosea sp. F3-2]|uniref:lipopolysaccharide biosynthesis protein n=1 Tax=Bosea sp. F3-2 TaxID=2599640 RepID=UPI0011EE8EB2|nr:lipopolysaccharide biosynthesis protein [Bosea sp. F3-2]QEL22967.1 lipopolysaccharide biosynthesis protein [Bosea sp. F3-2]